jgi:hypothetical protein
MTKWQKQTLFNPIFHSFGHWDFGYYLIIGAWDLILYGSRP